MAKKICANPMEVKNTCDCGYSVVIKNQHELVNRKKECSCGKPTKLIME